MTRRRKLIGLVYGLGPGLVSGRLFRHDQFNDYDNCSREYHDQYSDLAGLR
jgi:hypothetical protein